jgi:hypothetical protein
VSRRGWGPITDRPAELTRGYDTQVTPAAAFYRLAAAALLAHMGKEANT